MYLLLYHKMFYFGLTKANLGVYGTGFLFFNSKSKLPSLCTKNHPCGTQFDVLVQNTQKNAKSCCAATRFKPLLTHCFEYLNA